MYYICKQFTSPFNVMSSEECAEMLLVSAYDMRSRGSQVPRRAACKVRLPLHLLHDWKQRQRCMRLQHAFRYCDSMRSHDTIGL